MSRKKVGGGLLLVAAAFLGRETLVWLFNRLLDAASSGVRGGVTFVSFSWQNAAAVALALAGVVLVAWPSKKPPAKLEHDYDYLWTAASNIMHRVRDHRSTRFYARDRLEPASDIARDGIALLVTYEKAGFQVPVFEKGYAEQIAAGLEAYFSSLVPFMRQGHIAEAKNIAIGAAQAAVEVAKKLKAETEWFYPDF